MRTWKNINGTWYGYGNGFKAVLYESAETEKVKVLVHRNEHQMEQHFCDNVQSAKRWAERNYLKARNY